MDEGFDWQSARHAWRGFAQYAIPAVSIYLAASGVGLVLGRRTKRAAIVRFLLLTVGAVALLFLGPALAIPREGSTPSFLLYQRAFAHGFLLLLFIWGISAVSIPVAHFRHRRERRIAEPEVPPYR